MAAVVIRTTKKCHAKWVQIERFCHAHVRPLLLSTQVTQCLVRPQFFVSLFATQYIFALPHVSASYISYANANIQRNFRMANLTLSVHYISLHLRPRLSLDANEFLPFRARLVSLLQKNVIFSFLHFLRTRENEKEKTIPKRHKLSRSSMQ